MFCFYTTHTHYVHPPTHQVGIAPWIAMGWPPERVVGGDCCLSGSGVSAWALWWVGIAPWMALGWPPEYFVGGDCCLNEYGVSSWVLLWVGIAAWMSLGWAAECFYGWGLLPEWLWGEHLSAFMGGDCCLNHVFGMGWAPECVCAWGLELIYSVAGVGSWMHVFAWGLAADPQLSFPRPLLAS
jgi:hypothetical protein